MMAWQKEMAGHLETTSPFQVNYSTIYEHNIFDSGCLLVFSGMNLLLLLRVVVYSGVGVVCQV